MVKEAYQTVKSRKPDRKDHVWLRLANRWKCVLCGGLTANVPPAYPTPATWRPDDYEVVTEEERALCPREELPR